MSIITANVAKDNVAHYTDEVENIISKISNKYLPMDQLTLELILDKLIKSATSVGKRKLVLNREILFEAFEDEDKLNVFEEKLDTLLLLISKDDSKIKNLMWNNEKKLKEDITKKIKSLSQKDPQNNIKYMFVDRPEPCNDGSVVYFSVEKISNLRKYITLSKRMLEAKGYQVKRSKCLCLKKYDKLIVRW